MNINLRAFISRPLCYSLNSLAYEVHGTLAVIFPERAVIENDLGSFNLSAYEKAGHCYTVDSVAVFNKHRIELADNDRGVVYKPENAWLNVLWREQLLDVLVLTYV